MENVEIQEVEDKKRSLRRYRSNMKMIRRLEGKLASLDDRIKSVRSPRYTDTPRGGTPVTMEDLIADKTELEERIQRLKVKGRRFRSEILNEIDTLEDPRYADILESYFIDCLSLEDIAEEKAYTTRHVYRLYSEGVNWLALRCHKDDIT